MDGVYNWVKNIVYYLIFMTIITNLLPAGKYEKYLRLFAGCILILLVMQPLTGGLRMEEKIGAIFRSLSFENEAGELQGELDEMEQKRLDQLIVQYEKSAADELIRMAGEEGISAVAASVVIEGDSESPDFGKVKKIALKLKNDAPVEDAQEETGSGNRDNRITLGDVEKVSVRLYQEGRDREVNRNTENAGEENSRSKNDIEAVGRVVEQQEQPVQENEVIRDFRRTIAGYYQMEEENVEIRLED